MQIICFFLVFELASSLLNRCLDKLDEQKEKIHLLREELDAEKQKRERLENQIEELCASVNNPKLLVLQTSFFLYTRIRILKEKIHCMNFELSSFTRGSLSTNHFGK